MAEEGDRAVARLKHLIDQVQICKQSSHHEPQIGIVDEQLRQVNEKDYEPVIVSIGPVHRGEDRLKTMEQHKVRYLSKYVQRGRISIEKCVKELREIEERARRCYSNASSCCLDRDGFVEMLLLDGCFVIELVRRYWFEDSTEDDDPLFESDYTLSRIKRDIMLLENQLPFFVLNMLFDMTKTNDPEEDLQYLVLVFVVDILPWAGASKTYLKTDSRPDPDHLLGLMYQSCFSFSTKNLTSKNNGYRGNNNLLHISSASELRAAGIRLKGSNGNNNNNNDNDNDNNSNSNRNILDVTFLGGVLHLPSIHVSDNTESLMRNLIAYELRLTRDDRHYKVVTDYAFLMSCLINSGKDIAILRRHGVVSNFLGGDDKVCRMFNRLGSNVLRPSRFYYSDVFDRVSRRRGLPHKVWMAKLRRNYFNTSYS